MADSVRDLRRTLDNERTPPLMERRSGIATRERPRLQIMPIVITMGLVAVAIIGFRTHRPPPDPDPLFQLF